MNVTSSNHLLAEVKLDLELKELLAPYHQEIIRSHPFIGHKFISRRQESMQNVLYQSYRSASNNSPHIRQASFEYYDVHFNLNIIFFFT